MVRHRDNKRCGKQDANDNQRRRDACRQMLLLSNFFRNPAMEWTKYDHQHGRQKTQNEEPDHDLVEQGSNDHDGGEQNNKRY